MAAGDGERGAAGGGAAGGGGRWRRLEAWWERFDERVTAALWRGLWRYGVPLWVLLMLPMTLLDIGPAYRARFGGGTPGTFTARYEECAGACTPYGDFRSDDGAVTRADVLLASGSGRVRPGEWVRAVDTGDRAAVYPVGGGGDWVIVTAFLVGTAGLGVAWVGWLVGRRRAARGGPGAA